MQGISTSIPLGSLFFQLPRAMVREQAPVHFVGIFVAACAATPLYLSGDNQYSTAPGYFISFLMFLYGGLKGSKQLRSNVFVWCYTGNLLVLFLVHVSILVVILPTFLRGSQSVCDRHSRASCSRGPVQCGVMV